MHAGYPQIQLTVSAATNKLNGYTFDDAGNVITDADGRSFTYDAENKQVEVKDSVSSTIGTYYFDGDGKRVKKVVPSTGETTVFVYDAAGKQIAEYSTIVEPSSTAKVAYLTNDHLGSPRINTDQNGAITARHDYHPFGEEIDTSHRVTGLGYAEDTIRKQFTGYERDSETNLDFSVARYLSSTAGRWTSPDYFKNDTTIVAPQSWNLYAFARNNPLMFIDRSGRDLYIEIGGKSYKVSQVGGAFVLRNEDHSDSSVHSVQNLLNEVGQSFRSSIHNLIQDRGDNTIRVKLPTILMR